MTPEAIAETENKALEKLRTVIPPRRIDEAAMTPEALARERQTAARELALDRKVQVVLASEDYVTIARAMDCNGRAAEAAEMRTLAALSENIAWRIGGSEGAAPYFQVGPVTISTTRFVEAAASQGEHAMRALNDWFDQLSSAQQRALIAPLVGEIQTPLIDKFGEMTDGGRAISRPVNALLLAPESERGAVLNRAIGRFDDMGVVFNRGVDCLDVLTQSLQLLPIVPDVDRASVIQHGAEVIYAMDRGDARSSAFGHCIQALALVPESRRGEVLGALARAIHHLQPPLRLPEADWARNSLDDVEDPLMDNRGGRGVRDADRDRRDSGVVLSREYLGLHEADLARNSLDDVEAPIVPNRESRRVREADRASVIQHGAVAMDAIDREDATLTAVGQCIETLALVPVPGRGEVLDSLENEICFLPEHLRLGAREAVQNARQRLQITRPAQRNPPAQPLHGIGLH